MAVGLSTALLFSVVGWSAEKIFRFHVFDEPSSLDPANSDAGRHGYVTGNLFEGLLKYDNKKGLIPAGARWCRWKGALLLECELNPHKKWSDGSSIEAQDYVFAFQRLVDPAFQSRESSQLLQIKNAMEIIEGHKKAANLGVSANGPHKLIFSFEHPDGEFLLRLTNPALVPIKKGTSRETFMSPQAMALAFNGPYVLKQWVRGKKLVLSPNGKFSGGHKQRPPVEAYFVADEAASLQLYESGELSFLRMIPAGHVQISKTRQDFLNLPVVRFDYFGMSPRYAPFQDVEIRKSFAEAVDYEKSDRLFNDEKFGCAGLTRHLADDKHCLHERKTHLPEEVRKKLTEKVAINPPTFVYSTQGGEFNRITAEWLQGEWKKNLGITIRTEPREAKVFLSDLKSKTPPLFLKRIGVDRPTCLAALENFETGNPNNFIQYSSKEFENILRQMRALKISDARKKSLCEKALWKLIREDAALIPTGRFSLKMLMNPKAKGWRLNEMNQLDLSQLHWE